MNEEAKTEVEFDVDEKNIPVWLTDDGVIMGLKKEHFLNDSTKAVHAEAKKQFFLYMIEFKTYRANMFIEKAEALKAEAEDYKLKAQGINKVMTPKEKAQAKLAKLEKQLKAAQEALKAAA